VKDSFFQPFDDIAEESRLDTAICDDALARAIEDTKAVSHLPLDEEDFDLALEQGVVSEGSDIETDDESPKPIQKKNKASWRQPGRAKGINQHTYQCMDPKGGSSSQNPNERTMQILQEMCKHYDQMQDHWRTLAYRKAITTLRKQDTKITTKEDAAALPFIGTRLAEKIEEIVLTDRLRKLDNTRDDPTDKVLRLFLGVYGVGLSQANKWMQAGYRTLGDLTSKAKLTENQKHGIEHYEDFAARIPRDEVAAHGTLVRDALKQIDPAFEATVMGSYRRGAKDSGDIDLIITKPKASISTMRAVVFGQLVPKLFAAGFLKASLATSHRLDDGSKWHGASCLPGSTTWRRLDLLLVPEEEMGAALIYFTGNDIFNRSIRLLASRKRMHLNQRGLYRDVIRGRNREKLTEGNLVEGKSEKRIFEILGVPWRAPTERIC
jgi:DNA polymerase IV